MLLTVRHDPLRQHLSDARQRRQLRRSGGVDVQLSGRLRRGRFFRQDGAVRLPARLRGYRGLPVRPDGDALRRLPGRGQSLQQKQEDRRGGQEKDLCSENNSLHVRLHSPAEFVILSHMTEIDHFPPV